MSIRTSVSVDEIATELFGACHLHSNSDYSGLPADPQQRIAALLRDFPQASTIGVSELTLVPRSGIPYVVLVSPDEQRGDQIYTLDTKRSITIPSEVLLDKLGPAINVHLQVNFPHIKFLHKTWDLKTRTFYVAAPTINFRVGIQQGETFVYGSGDARAVRYYCGSSKGVYKKVNDSLQGLFAGWHSPKR